MAPTVIALSVQSIGSEKHTAVYPNFGVRPKAIMTLPAHSIRLASKGAAFLPMPGMLSRASSMSPSARKNGILILR